MKHSREEIKELLERGDLVPYETLDSDDTPLEQLRQDGVKFVYEYDFYRVV